MKVCLKCNNSFPNTIIIDNKKRKLQNRKFCLECSPFGLHNTKNIIKYPKVLTPEIVKTCSICNLTKEIDQFLKRTDRETFYSHCKSCSTIKTLKRQHLFKRQCIEYKGGSCDVCTYDKCLSALEFHHLDPTKKDFNISKHHLHKFDDRIKLELDKCQLCCANCHHEIHWLKNIEKFKLINQVELIPGNKTKFCPRCKIIKDISQFYESRKNPGIYYSHCKSCNIQLTLSIHNKFKQECIIYKGGSCNKCNYNKCIASLEFHHIDSSLKDFEISRTKHYSLNETTKNELDKCLLLCVNCHRETHWNLNIK